MLTHIGTISKESQKEVAALLNNKYYQLFVVWISNNYSMDLPAVIKSIHQAFHMDST